MDPLTISTGVLACISISLKVLVGLKQLKANVGGRGAIGGASIEVLAGDISGLRMVLQRMEEAFQDVDDVDDEVDDEVDAPRETGERGAHRRDLRRCLSDGYRVLSGFDLMVLDLNKRVKVHALSRLQSRLASAAARFLLVGQQVRAWRIVFQISLEAMKPKPALDVEPPMLTDEFHRLVATLDMEIRTLENSTTTTTTTGQADAKMVETIAELKRCVVSAMSVFSAPAPTEESRVAGSLLLTHDGSTDWAKDGSADGDRWQTSPPDDYGLESASPQASTTLPMPEEEEEAMRPTALAAPSTTLTAPPTPTSQFPSHANSPAEASGYPHTSGHTGHRHPLHTLTSSTHQHWPPGPVIMYMAPVSRSEKDQKEPNTSMSAPFPVQVIFGPPPASGHPPMTLQHLATPPRSAGLPSSPATTHSRQSTTSSIPSIPSIPSIVPPQHRSLLPQYHPQDVLLRHKKPPPPQPALRSPSPEVQRKQRSLRTRQLPQPSTQARPPQPPPPKSHRGSEQPRAAAAKHAEGTSTARKKQLRFMPGNPDEARDRSPGHPEDATRDSRKSSSHPGSGRRQLSTAATQKRKPPTKPFAGWKRLLPGSSSGRQNPSPPRRRRKLCFIGDRECGKTCLLRATTEGTFSERYEPSTCSGNYVGKVEVKGVGQIELEMWDTALGREDCNDGNLRALPSHPDSDFHALVLCFSIGDPSSYHNLLERWWPEALRLSGPETSIFVVGCKKDLRRYQTEDDGGPKRCGQQQLPLTTVEGLAVAGRIGARMYIETSAKSSHGIESILAVLAEEMSKTAATTRTETLAHVAEGLREDARLIDEERRTLRDSGEILTPREKEYASRYARVFDAPDSTVWKLRGGGEEEHETAVVDKGLRASRSRGLFTRSG